MAHHTRGMDRFFALRPLWYSGLSGRAVSGSVQLLVVWKKGTRRQKAATYPRWICFLTELTIMRVEEFWERLCIRFERGAAYQVFAIIF